MKYCFLIFVVFFICSCNFVQEKTNKVANKTGEVVAQAGAEFADGIAKGVNKAFNNEIELSKQLADKGIQIGKTVIGSAKNGSDNVLAIYFIFNNNVKEAITIKLEDEKGKEFGRLKQTIKGETNQAFFIDFIFTERTNIDAKTKVIIY